MKRQLDVSIKERRERRGGGVKRMEIDGKKRGESDPVDSYFEVDGSINGTEKPNRWPNEENR